LLKSAQDTLLIEASKMPELDVTSTKVPSQLFLNKKTLGGAKSVVPTNRSWHPSLLKSPHAAVCPEIPNLAIPTSLITFSNLGNRGAEPPPDGLESSVQEGRVDTVQNIRNITNINSDLLHSINFHPI
jgi:hypothetical protein